MGRPRGGAGLGEPGAEGLGRHHRARPFDGAVAERRISAGEFAQMGRVVAVVVRDNPLRFRVDIPESDSGKMSEGKT